MLKLSRKSEYALMSIRYIAENQSDLITAREICDRFSAPFDTMAKVLQLLNGKGILQSVKGVKGGYRLITPLNQITLKDFLLTIDGSTHTISCQGAPHCELSKKCNIAKPIEKLNERLSHFLDEMTLAELFTLDNGDSNGLGI